MPSGRYLGRGTTPGTMIASPAPHEKSIRRCPANDDESNAYKPIAQMCFGNEESCPRVPIAESSSNPERGPLNLVSSPAPRSVMNGGRAPLEWPNSQRKSRLGCDRWRVKDSVGRKYRFFQKRLFWQECRMFRHTGLVCSLGVRMLVRCRF